MDKQRLPYEQALEIAQGVLHDLEPFCERIAIAGSLRRKKETIGDIEVVCIPKKMVTLDMFGEIVGTEPALNDDALRCMGYKILKGGDKYKQIELPQINLDLFITTPEQWGVIFAIRTGSADFSHWLVTSKQKGGGMPSNMKVQEGRLTVNGKPVDTPEERDVFSACGLKWVEPEKRTEGFWRVNAWAK